MRRDRFYAGVFWGLVALATAFFVAEAAAGLVGPALWWLINDSLDIETAAELGVTLFLVCLAVTAYVFQRDRDRRDRRDGDR